MCPHSTPGRPHSRHSRTFACLPHFSAARSLCSPLCRRGRGAGARLPATSRPCALRGDTVTRLRRGHGGGQRAGPGPGTHPAFQGGSEAAHGEPRLPPFTQRGGTFGADELRVLLPGAAEILERRRLGLEALELLQPILQAPGSLQHRSGVCGMQDGR